MIRHILHILILLGFVYNGAAQLTDDKIFTLDSFITQVKKYHPVAKQADILVDQAAADLLSARGNFDPYFQFSSGSKTFDGKNYYYYNNPELAVPLPVGKLQAGFENNGGGFLNPEITSGKTGYAGVEIPLLRGVLTDKRRAALQQAKIYGRQSMEERLVIRNNLLFDAYVAYWAWAAAYQQFQLYTNFVDIASQRLRLVRIAFNNGDRALMDTTEAYIQLQHYQLMQMGALLKWKNSGVELSNYLWQPDGNVNTIKDNQQPERFEEMRDRFEKDSDELIKQAALQNPLIRVYDFKLSSLEVDKKLKRQNMLPYVALKANLLSSGYSLFKNVTPSFLENNHRWGIDIKIPLFLKEARGDYKKAKLKIEETKLELMSKRQQTENKIRTYVNEYSAISLQLRTLQSMYKNYQVLLRNEELKFAQGESSLFLVNSRESKLIELLQQQIELTGKLYKTKYAIEWSAGILN
jgi:outer membrane protein TolC